MTLRKASTLVYVAGFLVAAAMLSDARPTAAVPALTVTSSAAQPMAAAGSDATANQGVALASILREDHPIYTAAALAKAASACTRLAALCEKPSPSMGKPSQIRTCMTCSNDCLFARVLANALDRPTHELRHWRILETTCNWAFDAITKVYPILLDTWCFGAYRWRACSKRFQTL